MSIPSYLGRCFGIFDGPRRSRRSRISAEPPCLCGCSARVRYRSGRSPLRAGSCFLTFCMARYPESMNNCATFSYSAHVGPAKRPLVSFPRRRSFARMSICLRSLRRAIRIRRATSVLFAGWRLGNGLFFRRPTRPRFATGLFGSWCQFGETRWAFFDGPVSVRTLGVRWSPGCHRPCFLPAILWPFFGFGPWRSFIPSLMCFSSR